MMQVNEFVLVGLSNCFNIDCFIRQFGLISIRINKVKNMNSFFKNSIVWFREEFL